MYHSVNSIATTASSVIKHPSDTSILYLPVSTFLALTYLFDMPAPRFLTSLMSVFPLIEYDEQEASSSSSGVDEYPAQPNAPTLWIYGPGINDELESFDLACLRAQAEAAFRGVKVETRILQVAEGAPGGQFQESVQCWEAS